MPGRLRFLGEMKNFSRNTAIVEGDRRYTYDHLLRKAEEWLVSFEAKGPEPGDVVGIRSDWTFDAVALFFALAERGAIAVPIVTEAEEEVQKRLASAQCEWLFDSANRFEARKIPKAKADHPLYERLRRNKKAGLVLFSSGSTGEPKAMLHDLDLLIDSYVPKKNGRNTLVLLTFDHIGGIDTMMRAFASGGTVTIPASRHPEDVCRAVENAKVEVLPASPTFLNLLLISGLYDRYDLSSLRIMAFGAEPMPPSLLRRLKETFPKMTFQQKFGTSETNAIRIVNDDADPLSFRIDDAGVEYRIVDGELWLKSETRVMGYLNASMENFTEDGWFRTGDLVEEDEKGRIRIVSRLKEIVNVGGEKVYPAEVESVLMEMDEVADVVVYGESNAITGQSVAADIVPAGDIDARTMKKSVRKFCRGRLENYKIPSRINLVDRTSFGERLKKIRRRP